MVFPSLVVFLVVSVLTSGIQGVLVGDWTNAVHGISGSVKFPNPTAVELINFVYDGSGPDVVLYFYGVGVNPNVGSGTVIPLSGNENKFSRAYSSETVLAEMPSGSTVCDIGTLAIWCRQVNAIFAQVSVNGDELFVKSSPNECRLLGGNTDLPVFPAASYSNCEPFSESLQVSWTVDSTSREIDFEMCSCRASDSVLNQYMGFGLSGASDSTAMIGADATIAWLDNAMGTPNAVDYFLNERVQCRGGAGACPDVSVANAEPPCTNDVRADSITGGTRRDVQQCVAFSRPWTTSDPVCDIDFDISNQDQYIVWAIGGLGETAFVHFVRSDPSSPPIHLGRDPQNQCTTPIVCASCTPFKGSKLDIPKSTTLRVFIGPSAGERGYMSITSQAGWGIAWYVNDTLIPELLVRRGSSYTFIIEGGNDASILAMYHPFYITNSKIGGRVRNTDEQKASEIIYAGFDANDEPTGVGRLCERSESSAAREILDSCGSKEDYINELRMTEPACASGESGTFTWTPNADTPDIVYYQCATHQNLGWKIKVSNGDVVTTSIISLYSILLHVLSVYLFM